GGGPRPSVPLRRAAPAAGRGDGLADPTGGRRLVAGSEAVGYNPFPRAWAAVGDRRRRRYPCLAGCQVFPRSSGRGGWDESTQAAERALVDHQNGLCSTLAMANVEQSISDG